ncbi:MAG: endonuclease/exonuclease/phosphatase family protein [Promethearchaeota archaeon]
MVRYQNSSSILLIGIITYLFIEAFYNVIVNINAYVFMNISEILTILPMLLIAVFGLIAEIFLFMFKKINRTYKPFILLYLISALRICSQFIVLPSVIFIINFLMLFALLLFFMAFFILIGANDTYMPFLQFVGSAIIGLGIYYALLIVNISSNITSDTIKIIPTFLFIGFILYVNHSLFTPKTVENLLSKGDNNKNDVNKKNTSLFHFIILGVLFIYSTMWILNPMALSAYDIINLNINGLISQSFNFWPAYGFTYYIILILGTAVLSYVVIQKYIFSLSEKLLKIIIISSIGLTALLTFLAKFVIETDLTIISSIYTSIMTIVGVFSIILYLSYLFNFYAFQSSRKLMIGIIVFFLTALFFLLLHLQILWGEHMSLINHVVIQITICFVLISIYEIITIKASLITLKRPISLSKTIVITLATILIINGVSIGVLVETRRVIPPENPEATVMIWNLHNAIGDDDIFSLERIVQDIQEFSPTIIGLNEVDLGNLKTSAIDLASYFAYRLNMYYFYGYTFYKHYGNAILSKYPILDAEIITLPKAIPSAEQRALIRAKIEFNSSIWTIFITHLSTEEDDRLIQVPFIISEIEKEALFEKIIFMGDFNFVPSSVAYSLINSTSILKFTDTYRILNSDLGNTSWFDEDHNPTKRIDYIMCSPDLNPKTCEVFCSLSSDHCSVITGF